MADYRPERDASLGLIFRLNALWEKADRKALSGDKDGWELVLDRIYSNLLYRKKLDISKDKEGKISDVGLCDEDKTIQEIIKRKIRLAKVKKLSAMRQGNLKGATEANTEHYLAIMLYDQWLRKFMQGLGGMYLRESESNPSNVMFGGS